MRNKRLYRGLRLSPVNNEFREVLYDKGTFEPRPRIPVAEVLVQKFFKSSRSRKDPSVARA